MLACLRHSLDAANSCRQLVPSRGDILADGSFKDTYAPAEKRGRREKEGISWEATLGKSDWKPQDGRQWLSTVQVLAKARPRT